MERSYAVSLRLGLQDGCCGGCNGTDALGDPGRWGGAACHDFGSVRPTSAANSQVTQRREAGAAQRQARAANATVPLGYSVDADRGVDGGYRLGGSTGDAALLLDNDEATALAVALHSASLRWRLSRASSEARGVRSPSSPPSSDRGAALGVRRVPVPARDHLARGALVPAVRLSYRDVEELLAERGVDVDHVTIFRWVQRFTPELIDPAPPCRHPVGGRWFVDETYVRVAGIWRYVYRAVDQHGQVIDILVSPRRDGAAARRFFHGVLGEHARPEQVTTDKAKALIGAVQDVLPDAE